MKKRAKEEFYWPLGLVQYGAEIEELYPDEAQLLGAITILWNHHEDALRSIFSNMFESGRKSYCEAIWDRQPTHQAKRNLLAMALEHVELTDRQRLLLEEVLKRTKKFADRRNDLIHGIYEVHGRSSELFARVKSRGAKAEKRQRSSKKALQQAVQDLEMLMQLESALSIEMIDPDGKLIASMTASWEKYKAEKAAKAEGGID